MQNLENAPPHIASKIVLQELLLAPVSAITAYRTAKANPDEADAHYIGVLQCRDRSHLPCKDPRVFVFTRFAKNWHVRGINIPQVNGLHQDRRGILRVTEMQSAFVRRHPQLALWFVEDAEALRRFVALAKKIFDPMEIAFTPEHLTRLKLTDGRISYVLPT